MCSRRSAATTTSTPIAPATTICAVYRPISSRSAGTRATAPKPANASAAKDAPPACARSAAGARAGGVIRATSSADHANVATVTASAGAIPHTPSTSPATAGPAKSETLSIVDDATFAAVSSSGVDATSGSSADCAGWNIVASTGPPAASTNTGHAGPCRATSATIAATSAAPPCRYAKTAITITNAYWPATLPAHASWSLRSVGLRKTPRNAAADSLSPSRTDPVCAGSLCFSTRDGRFRRPAASGGRPSAKHAAEQGGSRVGAGSGARGTAQGQRRGDGRRRGARPAQARRGRGRRRRRRRGARPAQVAARQSWLGEGPGDRAFVFCAELREDAFERVQQLLGRCAPRVVVADEPFQRAREPCDGGRVAGPVERGPRSAGGAEQVERDRGLVREQPEQLHLLEREARVLRAVEHLQHAEHALVEQQRHRHQPLRHVACPLGHVAGVARVVLEVVDDERRARRQHPARDAGGGRNAHPDERLLFLARDGREDELDDRAQERAEPLLGRQDAGGDRGGEVVTHRPPPTLSAIR